MKEPTLRRNYLYVKKRTHRHLTKLSRNHTMNTKNAMTSSNVAWNALMKELRTVKASAISENGSLRKKRRARFDQQDMSVAGDTQERKVRCLRSSQTFSSAELLGSNSNTFLDLSPPSQSLDSLPSFTFGRHYKQISLAGLAKSSCGCAGVPSEFDVFSSYRCPCKSRSTKTPTKATPKKSAVSSSKKVRAAEAI